MTPNVQHRIAAWRQVGEKIKETYSKEKDELSLLVQGENPWFTSDNIEAAILGVTYFLDTGKLEEWLKSYNLENQTQKVIGLVMAGNIPMVGFHDLFCTLLAGCRAQVKLSSDDSVLMKWLIDLIIAEETFKDSIELVPQLKGMDAVIATGSDNTARYFDYYFGKYPNIIRKNRTGVAILSGNESAHELHELGKDIFQYFGLGCRNVSKLFVPQGYDFTHLFGALKSFDNVMHFSKYSNNYDYQKAILLVNHEEHLDTGFCLFKESTALVSPISVIYFEYYENQDSLTEILKEKREKIQCVLGNTHRDSIAFGKAQRPEVWDYADGIDTMKFLSEL